MQKEIERKRRHNIAAGVEAIAGILPNGDKEKYKGQILFRAVEYMQQLQKDTVRLPELEARNVQLEDQLEQATSNMPGFQGARIEELERQNQVLRQESEDQARKWALEKGVMEDELMSLRVSHARMISDRTCRDLIRCVSCSWLGLRVEVRLRTRTITRLQKNTTETGETKRTERTTSPPSWSVLRLNRGRVKGHKGFEIWCSSSVSARASAFRSYVGVSLTCVFRS